MLKDIWESGVVSNGGPYHQRFEQALRDQLQARHVNLFTNATLGLIAVLKALGLQGGEVVTTPYTFVATANALRWAGLTPVFADIDPHTLNLDPAAARAAIGPRTVALLPVHAYGNPCNHEGLAGLAGQYGLKLVYDAAPCFGVRVGGRSVLAQGDASVASFHATKVFNTFEGAAVVCADARVSERLARLRNHGLDPRVAVEEPGLNAKMSEFNAALGLLQLERVAQAIECRREIDRRYRQALSGIPGIECLALPAGVELNHAYFPIFVGTGYPLGRDALYQRLQDHGVDARRYFHPLVCDLPAYRCGSVRQDGLVAARRRAAEVICLPIHPALTRAQQDFVIELIAHPHGTPAVRAEVAS
ncbi:DegT/DnrJ/EryC1/StrS aminotransferase family protein [uncultured Azohydromonas sp.]|uniref:DegT/DnrJ/EryC1/StrS family aminotransferase n=1 Tax=uncultured Azohydromonas sp. TaxID=487342 RepID=UPI0026022989|nr:DegT/DnrJ/EryC1/StrS family aminotransferase [uncultured Azohydromonas sp.]